MHHILVLIQTARTHARTHTSLSLAGFRESIHQTFLALRRKQPPSATSSSTMGCVGSTAVSVRPSSAIFRRGPSTSPCMTGSRPASAKCPWASIRRSQSQNGSTLRLPRRAISPSCASTRGPSTSSPPWSLVRPAPSAPIRFGSSKRALWCVAAVFLIVWRIF